MILRWGVGALLVVIAAAVIAWGWWNRCESACADAERAAMALLQRGDLVQALERIDDADAHCRCSRFTSGDAPPQYALAQACLARLRAQGRSEAIDQLAARARGEILRELLGRTSH